MSVCLPVCIVVSLPPGHTTTRIVTPLRTRHRTLTSVPRNRSRACHRCHTRIIPIIPAVRPPAL